jgi:hypothetical protein
MIKILKDITPRTAITFLHAFLRHAMHLFPNVSDEVYEKRLEECKQCDQKTEDWKCADCKCDLILKARWADQECPRKKWGREEPTYSSQIKYDKQPANPLPPSSTNITSNSPIILAKSGDILKYGGTTPTSQRKGCCGS